MKLIICLLITIASWAHASVHVTTFNLKNFKPQTYPHKIDSIFGTLKSVPFDIIAFQEVIDTGYLKRNFKIEYPDFEVISSICGGAGNQQLALAYNTKKYKLERFHEDKNFSKTSLSSEKKGCGYLRSAIRVTLRDLKTQQILNIMNVHLKAGNTLESSSKRWMQYSMVSDYLKSSKIENLIVLGDFNSTGYLEHNSDFNAFESMLENTEYNSSADQISCSAFWSGFNRRDNEEVPSLLDHILFKRNFLGYKGEKIQLYSHCQQVKCYNSSRSELGESYKYGSDHCPVSIEFN